MYRVITVVCILRYDPSEKARVNITEHEHPQIKAAIEEGYVISSITPTVGQDGKLVTLTFILKREDTTTQETQESNTQSRLLIPSKPLNQ